MKDKPSVHPYVLALFLVAVGLVELVQHIVFVLGMVALAAIPAALLALLAWVTFVGVSYARADREMRISIRQAWLIRRRWRRLSVMLRLTVPVPKSPFSPVVRGDNAPVRLRVHASEFGRTSTA